jgi:sulfonate transport system permease protein
MSSQAVSGSRRRLQKIGRAAVLPGLVLGLWALAAQRHWVNPLIAPAPNVVLARALTALREGEIFGPLLASLRRDLLGFALGSLAGVALGGAMGASRWADRLIGPTFHAWKQVAIFAWIPLLSVWLGTGESAKVVFIALSAFHPVVQGTYQGVHAVAREYVEVARVLRFTRLQLALRVVLPAAAPSIFAGLHLALVYSWLATLGAEYLLAAGEGIGNMMIDGREQLAMDQVLLGLVIVGAVGALLNAVASRLERRTLRFRARST